MEQFKKIYGGVGFIYNIDPSKFLINSTFDKIRGIAFCDFNESWDIVVFIREIIFMLF